MLNYTDNLHEYKQGLADALLIGAMRETYSDAYKQGYDFGLTLYCDLLEQEENETDGDDWCTDDVESVVNDYIAEHAEENEDAVA